MKTYKTLFAVLAVTLILQSYPAHAGFWSTFFGNVASDSVKGSGKAGRGQTIDPLLKEKKVQGALAMMGYFKGKGDGDLNSFDSRTAIKAFQKDSGKEASGILEDTEIQQLLYLSNLYISLKKGESQERRIAIYDEIDATIDSMKEKSVWDQATSYFNDNRVVRVMVDSKDAEDAAVLVDGVEKGTIQFGYNTQHLSEGNHEIGILKISDDKEWEFSGAATVEVVGANKPTIASIAVSKNPTEARLARLAKEKKEKEERIAKHMAKAHARYKDNKDGTVTDKETNLTWMRCSLGQTWKNGRCKGNAKWFEVEDAYDYARTFTFANRNKWRVPTIEELRSLIYCGIEKSQGFRKSCKRPYRAPTIFSPVFPDTIKNDYWSSTYQRSLDFERGGATRNLSTRSSPIRLVHDG